MTSPEILTQLDRIFRDVLGNEHIVLSDGTTADDIPEWDSLTHIQLIVAIEKHFKVRFTSGEIRGFKNVGDMCHCIHSKLSQS